MDIKIKIKIFTSDFPDDRFFFTRHPPPFRILLYPLAVQNAVSLCVIPTLRFLTNIHRQLFSFSNPIPTIYLSRCNNLPFTGWACYDSPETEYAAMPLLQPLSIINQFMAGGSKTNVDDSILSTHGGWESNRHRFITISTSTSFQFYQDSRYRVTILRHQYQEYSRFSDSSYSFYGLSSFHGFFFPTSTVSCSIQFNLSRFGQRPLR